MRRLAALSVAALALALPATPALADMCAGLSYLGACVHYGCTGDPCRIDPFSVEVYTYCEHPVPPTVCAVVLVHG